MKSELSKKKMEIRTQRILIWIGILFGTIYTASWIGVVGFFPPPPANLEPAQVVAIYSQNNLQLRIGAAIMVLAGAFFLPWAVVISVQISRHEKGIPVWAITQGLAGVLQTWLLAFPPVVWVVCAFSVERAPELTLLMHELAFITYVTPASYFPFNMIPIAAICFLPKPQGIATAFPRWLGYLTFFSLVSGEFGVAAQLFKVGPFSWNGLISFWLPTILYGTWLTVMVFSLLRTLKHQERAGQSVPAVSPISTRKATV